MTKILNARILVAVAMIIFVGAVTASATGAFFSDTETSTGNTFAAGDIDLQIDNESYATDCTVPGREGPCTGALVASPNTSWTLTDLIAGTHKFFNFSDVKPGDVGEDTISIHVGSNDAWLCAAARLTSNKDNDCTEPETTDETGNATTCGAGNANTNGDLASQLNFAFWKDDGDNVLETDEVASIFVNGSLAGLGSQGKVALSDSNGGPFGTQGVPGGSTVYIAKAWCFGALSANAVAQDGLGKLGTPSNDDDGGTPNGPLIRGTGVTCAGGSVNNISQTDSVEGDMQFYAVQKRNNPTFTCAADYPGFPAPEQEVQAPQGV